MNSNPFNTRFLQTIGAYGCALFIGVYLASYYSGFATKAVFILIPVIPAEVASQSTHVLAELDLDTHSRYVDLVSQAS